MYKLAYAMLGFIPIRRPTRYLRIMHGGAFLNFAKSGPLELVDSLVVRATSAIYIHLNNKITGLPPIPLRLQFAIASMPYVLI